MVHEHAPGRGDTSRVKLLARLRVMRSVIQPTLTSFGRTRPWTRAQIGALQTAQNYALQRVFGLDRLALHELHITNEQLHNAALWPPIRTVLMRQTLRWLGHVCRMQIHRLPKLALFGTWIQNTSSPIRSHNHLIWIHTTLTEADIHPMDFFRLAQKHGRHQMGTANQTRIPPASPYPRCRPHAQPLAQRPPPPRPQSPTLSSNPEYVAYPGEQSARKCRASSNSRPTGTSTPLPTHPRHHGSRPHHLLQLPMQRMPQNLHHTPCTPQSWIQNTIRYPKCRRHGLIRLETLHSPLIDPLPPSMETLHGWLFQPPRPAKRWLGSGRLPWRRPRRRPLPLRTVRPCLPRQRGSTLSRSRAG